MNDKLTKEQFKDVAELHTRAYGSITLWHFANFSLYYYLFYDLLYTLLTILNAKVTLQCESYQNKYVFTLKIGQNIF